MVKPPIYYAEMYALHQNTEHKVGAVRLPPNTALMIHEGAMTAADIFGTEEDPGTMRVRLLAYVPKRIFNDQVVLDFRLADQNGMPVMSKPAAARAAAEAAFGSPKESGNA